MSQRQGGIGVLQPHGRRLPVENLEEGRLQVGAHEQQTSGASSWRFRDASYAWMGEVCQHPRTPFSDGKHPEKHLGKKGVEFQHVF